MKSINKFTYILLILFFINSKGNSQNANWVNNFIGTAKSSEFTKWGNYGGLYPGAVAPWGMTQLSPETSTRPMEEGYFYEDSTILAFSCHSHFSGYPNGSKGQLHISFWPTNQVSYSLLNKGRIFTHKDEEAQPGYYTVTFKNKDKVEMTATNHNGLFRYQSTARYTTLVITEGGMISKINEQTIQAENLHSIMRFEKPFQTYTIKKDTAFFTFKKEDTQKGLNIWLSVSAKSFDKSIKNAQIEIPEWDFDKVKASTFETWNKELDCIQVKGGTHNDITKLYTALYHSCLVPSIVSDADDITIEYGHFSPWDTFRSLHPLLTLLKPERQLSMVKYIMERYKETGELPKGPMTGFHIIPILLDSYIKDVANIPPIELLNACESLVNTYNNNPAYDMYCKNGYVQAKQERSVSITSELAYNDWCLSKLAYLSGEKDKASKYEKRALNYRNLFDVNTGFLLPKNNGTFLINTGELGFQESDKWTGSYFVPHNIQDIINLIGGDCRFTKHLEMAFNSDKILFDNEPVFHYPYLFTWAGRPDLTVKYVHHILQTKFRNTPNGITGNDDLGSMSSWYVLSAIGLFPACPGSGEYLLSEPLFDEITLILNNRKIHITKKGKASFHTLPSIWIDGKEHKRWFLSHKELKKSQQITFDGTRSHSNFSRFERPYSFTKGKPNFNVEVENPLTKNILSGEVNKIPFYVKNQGESGLFLCQLLKNGQLIAEKHLQVNSNEIIKDTLKFTVFKEGSHKLQCFEKEFSLNVKDSKLEQPFKCLDIYSPSLIPYKEKPDIQITLQNMSGKRKNKKIPLLINNVKVKEIQASLEPGEIKSFSWQLPIMESGLQEIQVLNHKHKIKVFEKPTDACLLWLNYEKNQEGLVTDLSGFENHAHCHGNLKWGKNYTQTGEQAYLTLPISESLMTATKQLSMITWIAPQKDQKHINYADFFTKGDYTCLKMENAQSLAFFAGGWGRGVCQITVPNDWYSKWHLVAGVCTGKTIQLYVDGELKQEIAVQGELSQTEVPWNIGRNAESPYSRFWNMKISQTRIYGAALSEKDIIDIYNNEKYLFQ